MLPAIMADEDDRYRTPRLLYIAYEFPVLTQTFTVAEVSGLARRGLAVTVLSCRRPREAPDPGVPASEVLPRAVSAGSVAALLFWLVRRPLRTAGTAWRVATARYRDQAARCRARGLLQLLWGARLAFRIRTERPKPHLHAQFVDAASTVAWVAARLAGATFSVTNHTAYNPYVLEPKLAEAARFFSISEFDRDLTLAMAGRREARNLRVVYQGIDLGRFAFRPEREPGDPARVLAVAALREKKGHHILIRAAARLRDRQIEAKLTIVGEGPERERLERLVSEHDLADRVDLVGAEPPERVRERLGAADVFVLACTTAENGDLDGIPISLMEAMAVGVPVVSTRVSGIPELIEDGEEGLLAEPDDADGIAERVARLVADKDLAERVRRGARRKVERRHDLEASVDALARELREVIA